MRKKYVKVLPLLVNIFLRYLNLFLYTIFYIPMPNFNFVALTSSSIMPLLTQILSFSHLLALTPDTTLVWLESPTNPTLTLVDIASIARIAKSYPSNPIVVVDNTFMSAYYQQPLSLGADVSMQSMTKYATGHSDVLMGSLVTNRKDLADKFKFIQDYVGMVNMNNICSCKPF